jgi:DNA-binding MarR family transcriptional regulator
VTATPDAEPVPLDVVDSLMQVSVTVVALLSKVAAQYDLSLTQLRVLGILRDRRPKMAELADYLGLERSSVSGLVDRAVSRGLVQRETGNEDGRAVHVSLTADGHRLARLLTEETVRLIGPMTGNLGAADQTRLATLLNRVLQ